MPYSLVYKPPRVLGMLNAMLIADFRLYSMVYSLLGGPWVVKKQFFWLYRPFFGYIPPSIAKKGWYISKRKVVCCKGGI